MHNRNSRMNSPPSDSDALNRFLIYYFLGVLFPQRKLWTFSVFYRLITKLITKLNNCNSFLLN